MRDNPRNPNRSNFNVLRASIDMARCFGLSKTAYEGELDQYGAVYSSNPARVAYLELCAVDPDSNATSDMLCDVEIIFYAKHYGYKGPAQS